ncbi:MAG: hypothetical protein V7641_358 [Blastocatellia bacterium]
MQGLWVRLFTPRLPDASGPCSGTVGSGDQPFDLIVLGESPVAGIGAATHESALTGQIASALAACTGRRIRWQAAGLSGATARRALQELVPQMAGRHADAVIIVLGVNDLLEWQGDVRWASNLEELISGVRQQVGNALIILTGVPPMEYVPAFPRPLKTILGKRAKLLDKASSHIAGAIPRVIHVSSQFELNRDFFCEDGFHPSESGYAQWGKLLAEVIASVDA